MSGLDELVRRCRQGELAAFTELFRRYEDQVYRLAVTILRDQQDAEDAVQDVFLRVFEQIKGYRGESSFKTWLTAIAVNRCRDRLRRRKVRRTLSLDRLRGRIGRNQTDLADVIAARQRRQTLWSLVDRLDDKYRLPVILHYHEGLSCGEVARVLGVRVSVVYSRLNTARLRLRAMLWEQEASNQGGREVEREPC
jgi:RNA polymerase sigma-70 factor (ECF subfamily)